VPETTAPLLAVDGISTRFETPTGAVRAVNDVSFEVREGELVGLVGESGSGKSATVRSLIGLVRRPGRVTAGSVRFEGADLLRLSPRGLRQVRGDRIGFVPQNPFGALNPVVRIGRQFDTVIRAHRKLPRAARAAAAEDILARLAIPDPPRVLSGYAHELSGGMAQRVVMGLAFVLNPRLVIADEPTTGLDLTVQRQILELVARLLETDRRAMLFVTHDLGIVAQYCHRVMVMYAGRIVESGPVREVFGEPAHPYTRALLDAVPRRSAALRGLDGSLPSLIDYPSGCPFRARCRFAFERCAGETPELRALSPGREAACHLATGAPGELVGSPKEGA
jgi:peptide/nickel transport system ATP-binding protein